MKRILLLCLCLVMSFAAQTALAQEIPLDVDPQLDPQTAQAIQAAIQIGDAQAAKKIYDDYKTSKKITASPYTAAASAVRPKPIAAEGQSIFEKTLSGIQQFGYETFLKTAASFAPVASVPVGPDYIIGPGDQFTVTLWGTTEGIYVLIVNKEGNITLPKVGVVSVAGLRFGELGNTLRRHLSKYYSNFNLSVAMGALKTITVYVVGEVSNPGSYSLPSLSTVYSSLFAAGGPTKKGTLRAIQVLRSGKVLRTMDLYDFLLKGDRQDMRLQHEDTVFVPLIGPVAGVSGAVYRPAIYELKGQENISDLIKTAGGIMPIALGGRLQLVRYSDNLKKVILDIKLDNKQPVGAQQQAKEFTEKIRNMDSVIISPVYGKVWETVELNGDVEHPGSFQWRPDLKVRELVIQGKLLPTADVKRGEIIRITGDMMDRTIIPIDLSALMAGDEAQNIPLEPQDLVRVYSAYKTAEKVTLSGSVVRAGEYEIHRGERMSDLLRRVGGFMAEAYPYGAVFKRVGVKNAEAHSLQQFVIKMQSQLLQSSAKGLAAASSSEGAATAKSEMQLNQGLLENLKSMQAQFEGRISIHISEDIDSWAGSKDDLLLQDGDSLVIPKRPQEVMVIGEVRNPGAQVYQPKLRVKDYLDQNGGLTDYAADGQIFVVQANGFAVSSDTPSVGDVEKMTLQAGDTIIVPQKYERYVGWRWTREILDVLFKMAVTVATLVYLL